MRRSATSAVLAGVMLAVVNIAAAQPPGPPPALTVCLAMSHSVAAAARREGVVLEEVEAIWRPMGVAVRLGGRTDAPCDRLIAVRLDLEATPEDASNEAALGWVPFVGGNARQLVYLRVSRARTMLYAVSPGKRPGGMTDLLVAKLLGRTLAHELGHVLLNSRDHDTTGLMRSRYHAQDVLRDPPADYTLDAEQRARLVPNHTNDTRLARR